MFVFNINWPITCIQYACLAYTVEIHKVLFDDSVGQSYRFNLEWNSYYLCLLLFALLAFSLSLSPSYLWLRVLSYQYHHHWTNSERLWQRHGVWPHLCAKWIFSISFCWLKVSLRRIYIIFNFLVKRSGNEWDYVRCACMKRVGNELATSDHKNFESFTMNFIRWYG